MTNSDEKVQVFPEAAVEAAAKHLAMKSDEDWSGDEWTNEKIDDLFRAGWREQAREILEAAAPHMLAGELEAVAEDLEESAQIIQVRSRDAGIDNEATVRAMNKDADWLRARAAAYGAAK